MRERDGGMVEVSERDGGDDGGDDGGRWGFSRAKMVEREGWCSEAAREKWVLTDFRGNWVLGLEGKKIIGPDFP